MLKMITICAIPCLLAVAFIGYLIIKAEQQDAEDAQRDL